MVLPTAAAVRQSCSVVLSWYGTISYTQPGHQYKDRFRTNPPKGVHVPVPGAARDGQK